MTFRLQSNEEWLQHDVWMTSTATIRLKRIERGNGQGVDDKVIRVSPRACAKWSECEVQITLQDY